MSVEVRRLSEAPHILRGFACVHGESEAETLKLRAEAYDALGCDASNLVSSVVRELNFEYGVTIDAIPVDMWSAVNSIHEETGTMAHIECDLIEDGFALTWRTWRDYSKANGLSTSGETK